MLFLDAMVRVPPVSIRRNVRTLRCEEARPLTYHGYAAVRSVEQGDVWRSHVLGIFADFSAIMIIVELLRISLIANDLEAGQQHYSRIAPVAERCCAAV